mmetsp:Transcript_25114/g.75388  ORF Transcript_25114/g.75388 Transcript_25114/m.75388 type:complete len:163 (+) Transcript_25114:153-641(+)
MDEESSLLGGGETKPVNSQRRRRTLVAVVWAASVVLAAAVGNALGGGKVAGGAKAGGDGFILHDPIAKYKKSDLHSQDVIQMTSREPDRSCWMRIKVRSGSGFRIEVERMPCDCAPDDVWMSTEEPDEEPDEDLAPLYEEDPQLPYFGDIEEDPQQPYAEDA